MSTAPIKHARYCFGKFGPGWRCVCGAGDEAERRRERAREALVRRFTSPPADAATRSGAHTPEGKSSPGNT